MIFHFSKNDSVSSVNIRLIQDLLFRQIYPAVITDSSVIAWSPTGKTMVTNLAAWSISSLFAIKGLKTKKYFSFTS